MEMTSSQGAKWKQPGPPVQHWLPVVAHVGVTCLWLAIYVHRFPMELASPKFGVGVLAGALVWPMWGGAKLLGAPTQPWAKVLGGAFMMLQVGLFMLFLPYLTYVR